MEIATIVFDLYNTLIRIENKLHPFSKIFFACGQDFDISYSEYIDHLLTASINDFISEMPISFERSYNRMRPQIEAELNSVTLFPETRAVIEDLASRYPLYLVSNLASPYKSPFFDLNLADWFHEALFSCNEKVRKPSSLIFKKVEELSGKSGKQILMVGDSIKSDIEGAKKMGWNYLRIERNLTREPEPWEITSLADIKERIS